MARAGLKYLAGALLATAVGVTFSTAYAQSAPQDDKPSHKSDGGPEGRPHREPPPQAYEDCKGKKEGDAVTIHPPGHGSVSATCESSPKGLFARPEHPPEDGGLAGRPPPEPPPQAYDDCKGKKEGDAVTIHPPGHDSVPATCESSPKGLFARPEHPPREGGSGGDHGPAEGDNGKNQGD